MLCLHLPRESLSQTYRVPMMGSSSGAEIFMSVRQSLLLVFHKYANENVATGSVNQKLKLLTTEDSVLCSASAASHVIDIYVDIIKSSLKCASRLIVY